MWFSICLLVAVANPAFGVPIFERQNGACIKDHFKGNVGIAASQLHPGIFYVHFRSQRNKLLAIDLHTAKTKAILTIDGAEDGDWESVAVGPCSPHIKGPCIYIGDTGTHSKAVYKVKEPTTLKTEDLGILDTLNFTGVIVDPEAYVHRWPEHESRCLMVDPHYSLYIISTSHNGAARFPHLPNNIWHKHLNNFHQTLPLDIPHSEHGRGPLGCDMSTDGKEILVKTETHLYYYKVNNGNISLTLERERPDVIPYCSDDRKGESVAWGLDKHFFLTMPENTPGCIHIYNRVGKHTPHPCPTSHGPHIKTTRHVVQHQSTTQRPSTAAGTKVHSFPPSTTVESNIVRSTSSSTVGSQSLFSTTISSRNLASTKKDPQHLVSTTKSYDHIATLTTKALPSKSTQALEGPSTTEEPDVAKLDSHTIGHICGIATSVSHGDTLYILVSDSTNSKVLAINPKTGIVQTTFHITRPEIKACEDIAVGPCPQGGSCIYIGDTGSDEGPASNTIYRVKEPEILENSRLELQDTITYSWQEHAPECLMVDQHGNTYIISRSRDKVSIAEIPAHAWGAWGGATIILTPAHHVVLDMPQNRHPVSNKSDIKQDQIDASAVACDLSSDGKDMLIRYDHHVMHYNVTDADVFTAVLGQGKEMMGHEHSADIALSRNGDEFYTLQGGDPMFVYVDKLGK